MKLQIPDKLGFLLDAHKRYKVAYGGRGAGKSWAFADCLLVKMMQEGCRVLCTREQQNSIKDSVHRLLQDRIAFYGLQGCFEITENEIRCPESGASAIFKGLRQNIEEIKSLEGIKYCWVEEGNRVSKNSLDTLTPTIRADDSEIWFSFNTGAECDEVYDRFVKQSRADTIAVRVNYYDNPWFPAVLKSEMEWDKEHNPERYKHVWLGEPGYEGRFFVEFGEHLREHPFIIPISSLQGRLFGSLDSGTTHATSFGLKYIDEDLGIHRLMTYKGDGFTIATHAQEIFNRLESFSYTSGYFPEVVVADPSMWTKVKLNEMMVRSPIDEYIDLFRTKGKVTKFEPANNEKVNGCQLMRMLFKGGIDTPVFRYWDIYNRSFEEGISSVVVDENNPEIYAKQDGDDCADESRYGIVKAYSLVAMLKQRKKTTTPKTHLEELLSGRFKRKTETTQDWYNG